jgi:hypothetical protein
VNPALVGITTPAGALAAESQRWLRVAAPPVSQSYPGQSTQGGPNDNWAAQMWSSFFVTELAGCKQVVITIAMLFGAGWNVGCSGKTISPQTFTDTTGKGNVPTPMDLADVAAGKWDPMFRPVFRMIAATYPNAIIRIGQEDWGNWYAWAGRLNEALRILARNHLIALALEESLGFRFVWDVARTGPGGYDPRLTGLNGAQHVDYVGFDLYDNMGALSNALNIINGAAAFGGRINKPVIVCEWGLQGKDDPAWATGVWDALEATPEIVGALYYDKDKSALSLYPKAGPIVAGAMAKVL